MTNDKATPLKRDDIADAIDAKVKMPTAQAEMNTSAENKKAEPAAKKPRRKLGQRCGGSRG